MTSSFILPKQDTPTRAKASVQNNVLPLTMEIMEHSKRTYGRDSFVFFSVVPNLRANVIKWSYLPLLLARWLCIQTNKRQCCNDFTCTVRSRVQIPWSGNLVEVFSEFLNLKIALKTVIFQRQMLGWSPYSTICLPFLEIWNQCCQNGGLLMLKFPNRWKCNLNSYSSSWMGLPDLMVVHVGRDLKTTLDTAW